MSPLRTLLCSLQIRAIEWTHLKEDWMRRRDWPRAAYAAVIAIAVVTAFIYRPGRRTEPPSHHGLYTAPQILDRARALCHALAPDAGELKLSVDRVHGYVAHPYWNVTAVD